MQDESVYHAEIKKAIEENDIVVFMKGTKEQPLCGFSAMVVQIFDRLGASFKDVNVLADEGLREAIKTYSDWPTIPQIYIKQEFIGGCDITREMYAEGELEELLKSKNLVA